MINPDKKKYLKKSYSQCGEDLIVRHLFDCLGTANPDYMDIGAHHPYYLSNTAHFYERGSTGINIEPDPTLFRRFVKHRKKDRKLNICISNVPVELDFYIISNPTLNTFSKEEAENYKKEGGYTIEQVQKIKVDSLEGVLKKYTNSRFPQFLSVDA